MALIAKIEDDEKASFHKIAISPFVNFAAKLDI